MSELIFVCYGQASFGKESYDKLSGQGIEQVRILRRHSDGAAKSITVSGRPWLQGVPAASVA